MSAVSGFLVVLSEPLHEDEAIAVRSAILRLRGVQSITAVATEPFAEGIAVQRFKMDLYEGIREIIFPETKR